MIRKGNNYGERQLTEMLYRGSDAYEANNADDMPMTATALSPQKGNPDFDAQFDISILTVYFTVAAGVYTLRTAAYILANAATLATAAALSFFVFGQSDFLGGYKKTKSQFPLTTWTYGNPFVYGNGSYHNTAFGVLDATAIAQVQVGDLVMPFTAVSGANYCALVIIRCANVSYGTLIAALSSDKFVINRIRYIQNDTSAAGLTQYANAIYWFKQSLFGKFDQDSLTPNSQKPPDQYQAGIIDLRITKNVSKEIIFGSALNYDAVSLQWSIFVKQVDKN